MQRYFGRVTCLRFDQVSTESWTFHLLRYFSIVICQLSDSPPTFSNEWFIWTCRPNRLPKSFIPNSHLWEFPTLVTDMHVSTEWYTWPFQPNLHRLDVSTACTFRSNILPKTFDTLSLTKRCFKERRHSLQEGCCDFVLLLWRYLPTYQWNIRIPSGHHPPIPP